MFFNQKNIDYFVFFGLVTIYFIFYTNLTIDDGSSLSLVKFITILFIISFLKYKKFYFNITVFLIATSLFLFFTLNEYLFHINQYSSDPILNKHYNKITNQFIYIIPLVFLPTLINTTKFKENYFFGTLIYSTILSIFFNSYLNLKFNFNRELLANNFRAIILYDYCLISISLITLVYSFKFKKNTSYLLIFICLLNIGLIVLHGSRGAWLGIPFALLIIFFSYYKTHLSQIIFIILLTTTASVSSLFLPYSPIKSRIDQFQLDNIKIKKNDYSSSVGGRVALWKFSIVEFHRFPLTGVGIKKFREDICELNKKHIISGCLPHAHNVFLQELATHGIFGLISIFILFFTPCFYFLRSFKDNQNKNIKNLSVAGICVITYIIFCSLTDFFFYLSFPTLFFYLTVISLISFIDKYKKNTFTN